MKYGIVHYWPGGTKAQYEAVLKAVLMPRVKQGISGGFTTRPQETTFEVHKLLP